MASEAFDQWVTEQTAGLGLTGADNQQTVGWLNGWAAAFDRISNWLGAVRTGLDAPTRQALAKAREYTDEACSRGQRNLVESGKVSCDCSRCTRYVAAWLARREYGQPDYPGVAAAARLRRVAS